MTCNKLSATRAQCNAALSFNLYISYVQDVLTHYPKTFGSFVSYIRGSSASGPSLAMTMNGVDFANNKEKCGAFAELFSSLLELPLGFVLHNFYLNDICCLAVNSYTMRSKNSDWP